MSTRLHRVTPFLALLLAVFLCTGVVACKKKADDTTAAPMAQGVRFVDAELGRSVGGDGSVLDATNDFGPNDTIYVSVETSGSASSANLAARWTYEDGQEVDRSQTTIAPTGPAHTEFHVSNPSGWPEGDYHVEVSVDGRAVKTLDFEVKS